MENSIIFYTELTIQNLQTKNNKRILEGQKYTAICAQRGEVGTVMKTRGMKDKIAT